MRVRYGLAAVSMQLLLRCRADARALESADALGDVVLADARNIWDEEDENVLPNFFYEQSALTNGTARIAPPRPSRTPCIGLQGMLALWRGGVTTLRALQHEYLAPAIRAAPACDAPQSPQPPVRQDEVRRPRRISLEEAACASPDASDEDEDASDEDEDASDEAVSQEFASQRSAVAQHDVDEDASAVRSRAPVAPERAREVFVAVGQGNTRRELAMAAATRRATTLLTQGEMIWDIHREPELARTATGYFLVMREPVSRLVSDFASYRADGADAHPLAAPARESVLAFARSSANYALRFFGNDTRCTPRRSTCASLREFDASIRGRDDAAKGDASQASQASQELQPSEERARSASIRDERRRAAQPCHLELEAEERRLYECALRKPVEVLRANLAYLKQNMHRLFLAVGLLERLPETLVLWRLAARHHSAANWPTPACIPAPSAPAPAPARALRVSRLEIEEIRELNALDLELYDAVRVAFKLQLLSATRHGGPEVKALLERARNGSLPACARPRQDAGDHHPHDAS